MDVLLVVLVKTEAILQVNLKHPGGFKTASIVNRYVPDSKASHQILIVWAALSSFYGQAGPLYNDMSVQWRPREPVIVAVEIMDSSV